MKTLRIKVEDDTNIFEGDAKLSTIISITGPRIERIDIDHIPVDKVQSRRDVINNLLAFMCANSYNEMIIDIDKWDSQYHVEELTIDEIEERLGHRIKIVDNK